MGFEVSLKCKLKELQSFFFLNIGYIFQRHKKSAHLELVCTYFNTLRDSFFFNNHLWHNLHSDVCHI